MIAPVCIPFAKMDNEQRFNVFTGLVGMVGAIVGACLLLVTASRVGDTWKIVSFGIYGSTLIILYTVTTLYHAMQGKARLLLREFDHYAIYLLIAGTYTPFCLVTLRGRWGWTMFVSSWVLAGIGIAVERKLRSKSWLLFIDGDLGRPNFLWELIGIGTHYCPKDAKFWVSVAVSG